MSCLPSQNNNPVGCMANTADRTQHYHQSEYVVQDSAKSEIHKRVLYIGVNFTMDKLRKWQFLGFVSDKEKEEKLYKEMAVSMAGSKYYQHQNNLLKDTRSWGKGDK